MIWNKIGAKHPVYRKKQPVINNNTSLTFVVCRAASRQRDFCKAQNILENVT